MRAAIVHGEYRPNERLVELDIAERLKASRTPIREAFQRLAAEDLIVRRPRRGWVVREFSPEELREIFETRAALEGFAARLAARRGSDEELRAISSMYPPPEELLVPSDAAERRMIVDLNDRYHEAIVDAARNRRLAEAIHRNAAYYFNYPLASMYSEEEHRLTLKEHERITEALMARDEDQAELHARIHILNALADILSKLGYEAEDLIMYRPPLGRTLQR